MRSSWGCLNPSVAFSNHERARMELNNKEKARFLKKLSIGTPASGCWVWHGALKSNGYGYVFAGGRDQNAHRVAYQWFVGPIPEGLELDHLCRNRGCVNPSHLEPVTRWENIKRGAMEEARQRRTTERLTCSKGHPWNEQNTYVHAKTGARHCRECHRLREIQRRHSRN